MSWMAKLYDTYEQAMKLDLPDDKKPMPVSHTRQNANINIVIDSSGNFKRASVLIKTPLVLPATEQSAGRTGKSPPPHPLCDKLHYVAKDYLEFGGQKPLFFNEYRALLASWCESQHSHPKAEAVLTYIDKGHVIRDLIQYEVLAAQSGKLITPSSSEEVKELKGREYEIFKSISKDTSTKRFDQGSALVCWTVEETGEVVTNTWTDLSLQKSWMRFDAFKDSVQGLCYVTGEVRPIASNHPSKILRSENGAKLVSANDTDGFTFRGRFTDNKNSLKTVGPQSVGISFETTQKAHNALRWLLSEQGIENGKQAIVAWAVSGKTIPAPLAPTFDLDNFEEAEDDSNDALSIKTDITKDMGQSFAKALGRYMSGYFDGRIASLSDSESIVIMGLDSATPGRMAITYYRDFIAKDYINTVKKWHLHLAWPQRVSKEEGEGKKNRKVIHWYIGAPSPWNILQATYGDVVKSNDALKKSLYERITPCITEGRPIPADLVKLAVRRVSNRYSLEQWEWEQNLGVACALYRGYHHPDRQPDSNQRRDYTMSLDLNNHSRDYLYGRLLAVAEKIEELALQVAGVNRTTTAARLMQRFADRPYSTWKTIYGQLQPYIQQLQVSRRGFIENRKKDLDEIMGLFNGNDFTNDKSLSGEYLLGFHCQRMALRKKQEDLPTTDNTVTPE